MYDKEGRKNKRGERGKEGSQQKEKGVLFVVLSD